MSLTERELARRSSDRVEIRFEPLRLRFRFAGLGCSDPHLLRINFSCSVQAIDNPIERRALQETFLSTRPLVTADDLIEHFQPALRSAASRLTSTRPAAEWIDSSDHQALVEALRQAAKPIEFDSGLKLLGPFELTIDSETLTRQRLEEAERKLNQRRARDQLQHIQHAARLLQQFKLLRQAAPQLSAGAVLQSVSPADRADMYEALLRGSASSAPSILWAVAGNDLLQIDPATQKPVTFPLPNGPFRSVRPDELHDRAVLLVGGRDRIVIFDVTDHSHSEFLVSSVTPQLGFNRALIHNDQLWATHGELGIRRWNLDGNPLSPIGLEELPKPTYQRPSSRISGSIQTIASMSQPCQPAGPRNLDALDRSRLIFSIGNLLATIDAQTAAITAHEDQIQAEILAIFPDAERLLIVHDNGTIHVRDRDSLELLQELPRSMRLCSAGLLPWLGETRLLLAQEDGCIDCIGLNDSLTAEYRSAYHDAKDLAASATTVAAITADRTRIVLWHAWDGRKPYAELHITALTRRRVADVCFG